MTKYIFSPYNNPALELYVEEDYPVTDISYIQRYMLVELKDYEYDHFVKVENEYNTVVEWMNGKQEEYAKGLNK